MSATPSTWPSRPRRAAHRRCPASMEAWMKLEVAGGDDLAKRCRRVAPALLGESPFWHPREAGALLVRHSGPALHRFDPASGAHRHWDFDSEPACCAPADGRQLLLAMRDGLWRFDPPGGARTAALPPPYDPAKERFNDGKADPQGRFWVGTIYEPRSDAAKADAVPLGRRPLERMADDAPRSATAWPGAPTAARCTGPTPRPTPSSRLRLRAGQTESCRASARSRASSRATMDSPLDNYGGRPDGAAVDAEGCYWVAMFEGQRLLRLSPGRQRVDARAAAAGALPDDALLRRCRPAHAVRHHRAREPPGRRTGGTAAGRLRAALRCRRAGPAGQRRPSLGTDR
jgi:hypothetical protein